MTISSLYLPGSAPQSTSGVEPIPGLPYNYNSFGVSCSKSDPANAVATFNSTIAGTKNAQGPRFQVILPTDYQLDDPTLTQDFSLKKTIKFNERFSLALTGQVFNAFNVSNLTGYGFQLDNLASGCHATNGIFAGCDPGRFQPFTFGQPTARAVQTFGSAGPRAFQLAGRINF